MKQTTRKTETRTIALTKDPRRAAQFASRRAASQAAKSIGWRAKDATQIDVLGFKLWAISDDHMSYVHRDVFEQVP